MHQDTTAVLLAFIALAFSAVVIYAYVYRVKHLLKEWAEKNRYDIIHAEYRLFCKGPFMWSSRGQAIYRVEIRDAQGNERKGWVRFGSWVLGVASDKVEVKWDNQGGGYDG